MKVDASVLKQLTDPTNRYSFVCNAIIDACSPNTSNEKLNDMAILCAELTASCNALSAEWLGKKILRVIVIVIGKLFWYVCIDG